MKDTVDPEWNHEEVINIQEAGDNQIDIRLYDKVNRRYNGLKRSKNGFKRLYHNDI